MDVFPEHDTSAYVLSHRKHMVGGLCIVYDNPGPGLTWDKYTRFYMKPGVPVLWEHDPCRVIGTVDKFELTRHGIAILARLFDTAYCDDIAEDWLGWSVGAGRTVPTLRRGEFAYIREWHTDEVSLARAPAALPTFYSMKAQAKAQTVEKRIKYAKLR